MSVDACAALVQKGDPDRFLSAMTAPPDARAPLMVLYAFNLEIARVPWITVEPIMAEMRLQWWADMVEACALGQPAPAHEVAGPLGRLVQQTVLPVPPLRAMADARRFDIEAAPLPDSAAIARYIDETAGNLMWLAALTLGAPEDAETVIRDFAFGSGVAALFMATPALVSARRQPFADTSDGAILAIARQALARLKQAHAARGRVPAKIAPALRAGWMAAPVLRRACQTPARVLSGDLDFAGFYKRLRLIRLSAMSRW